MIKLAANLLTSLLLAVVSVTVAALLAVPCALLRWVEACGRYFRGSVDLRGQVVVVTGAAGGFGTCVSRALIARGATVVGCDVVPADAIDKAVGVVDDSRTGGKLVAVKSDITKPADLAHLVERVKALCKDEKKTLYCLVNNAGITGNPGAVFENGADNMRAVFEVNCLAPVDLVRALYPMILKGASGNRGGGAAPTRGRVVNVTSVAGLVSGAGLGNYTASKYALEAMSDCLRMEVKDEFDVAIIEPYFADTGIYRALANRSDDELRKSKLAEHLLKAKERAKAKRIGNTQIMTPEFVSDVIVRSIVEARPRDRYLVAPNPVVQGLIRALMHLPNYCFLVDGMKDVMRRLR